MCLKTQTRQVTLSVRNEWLSSPFYPQTHSLTLPFSHLVSRLLFFHWTISQKLHFCCIEKKKKNKKKNESRLDWGRQQTDTTHKLVLVQLAYTNNSWKESRFHWCLSVSFTEMLFVFFVCVMFRLFARAIQFYSFIHSFIHSNSLSQVNVVCLCGCLCCFWFQQKSTTTKIGKVITRLLLPL